MDSQVYECLLTCIWQSSSFYYCMEVTDGPNDCDQAALGSPQHFFFLHVVYVDAVREACPVFGLLPTRYADDLISQKVRHGYAIVLGLGETSR